MATIVYNKGLDLYQMFRDDVQINYDKYSCIESKPRLGYQRTINTSILLHFSSYDKEYNRLTKEDFTAFLKANCKQMELPDKVAERCTVYIDVDPYMFFTDDCDLCLYFGDDVPVKTTKTVKKQTPHFKKWTFLRGYSKKSKSGYTYTYFEVKDESKLFILGGPHEFDRMFPEFKISENIWYIDPETGEYKSRYTELVTALSVFRCSGDYEYTEEEKEEIRKKKEAEEKARREYEEDLERRKNTPGYCSRCGAPCASYVPNPFDEEINGIINYEWLCDDCYNDYCGDI